MSEFRVGVGVDAHALVEGVPLVLGGVEFPAERGLAGHSDGDVVSHALVDAILGAAGLGDIGELFPSGDPQWHGASSLRFLEHAYAVVKEAGYELVNADCVLIGEVGLSGELRAVPHTAARLKEAAALGFKSAVLPKRLRSGEPLPTGITAHEARTLREALDAVMMNK